MEVSAGVATAESHAVIIVILSPVTCSSVEGCHDELMNDVTASVTTRKYRITTTIIMMKVTTISTRTCAFQ